MKPMTKACWLGLTLAVVFSFAVVGSTGVGWAAKKTKQQKAAAKAWKKHDAAQKKLNTCMKNLVKANDKCEKKPTGKQNACLEKAGSKYESCRGKAIKNVGKKNAKIQKKRDKARHKCGSKWAKCFKKCKSDKNCKDDCTEEQGDCVDKIDDLYPFVEEPHDSDD